MSKIQQIFNSCWAISRKDFFDLLSIIHPSIKAGNLAELERLLGEERSGIFAVNLTDELGEWDLEDESLPDNSIAVVNMYGVLYSWESERIARRAERALSNGKIAGLILRINGPGGMIDGIGEIVAALSNSGKPTATVITGRCMSAHYWIASATDRRFMIDKTCEAGSIGVVGTYMNASKAMEKEGIDYREIYPDTADLKNRETRDIEEKNDETAFKAYLRKIHALFCESVSKGLDIPYDKDLPLFRGATFMGDEAIRSGLADQYGSMQDAARWILARSVIKETEGII